MLSFRRVLPLLAAGVLSIGCAVEPDASDADDVDAEVAAAELRARGFEFRETLRGSFTYADGREVEMSFSIHAQARDMDRFRRDPVAEIDGSVTVGGLADARPLVGTLRVDPFVTGKIEYRFTFAGDDGGTYDFAGDKTVELFRPFTSLTTLPGEIRDSQGASVGSARLLFDVRRELGRWLRSLRFFF